MSFENFSVIRRNYGHWDIMIDGDRIFRVRGGPGKYSVIDERKQTEKKETPDFKTVGSCMTYICDKLMYELIVAEGQSPSLIEKWNV